MKAMLRPRLGGGHTTSGHTGVMPPIKIPGSTARGKLSDAGSLMGSSAATPPTHEAHTMTQAARPPYGITGGPYGNTGVAPPKKAGAVKTLPSTHKAGLMATAAAPKTNLQTTQAQATTYNPTGYTSRDATSTGYQAQQGQTATYDPASYQGQGYDATTGTASTYDPTQVDRTGTTYDPTLQDVQGNQLVSHQLNDLTDSHSRYIQQARQTARERAARSGLMTSSIAAGAAERAAIRSALPIAQANAARYGSVADQDMAAQNQADQFNAGQAMRASLADAQAANAASQFDAGQQNQMTQANMSAENRAAEFGANADNTANQFNANSANQAGQFNAGSQNQMTQANMDAANRAAEFGANADNNVSQFNANSANQAAAYSANAANAAGQFNVGQLNNMAQFNANTQNNMALNQQQLAERQYEFDRGINQKQTNQWFGSEFNRENVMGQILQGIYSNPNMTPEQQKQAASNAKTIFQGLWNATNTTFANGVPDVFLNV